MELCIALVITIVALPQASLGREVPLDYDWRMGEG